MSKLWVGGIVTAHFSTFRNYESKKPVPKDFVSFLGIPCVVVGVSIVGDIRVPEASVGALISGLAIFAGLLFNLLLLVADIAARTDKPEAPSGRDRLRLRVELLVLRELHANISFAVLLSLISLTTLVGLSLEGDFPGRRVTEFFLLFVASLFFLTLMMILKRAYALLSSEMETAERKAS